jgi:glyoxylase-like metal-dependent hydrolase (beta-lactamase superfamily II)
MGAAPTSQRRRSIHYRQNVRSVRRSSLFISAAKPGPRCLATPCHTQDSICYYVTDTSNDTPKSAGSGAGGAVFTGDTPFIAGCGVFFEGTGAEMHAACQLLSARPETTITYGHEYTAGNLCFALSVDPGNTAPRLARLGELVVAHPLGISTSHSRM